MEVIGLKADVEALVQGLWDLNDTGLGSAYETVGHSDVLQGIQNFSKCSPIK
jgi:hypothetical protein